MDTHFRLAAGNIDKALEAIKQDAIDNNRKLEFCFITEEQKAVLEEMFEGELVYSRDDGDSDYIYGQPELSTLAGRAYHKKKNHVSKFKRTYEELRYSEIGAGNTEDALMVEDMWYNEHKNDEDNSVLIEYSAIREALLNFDELSLSGGIIYVNDVPVAMTIASYISKDVVDLLLKKLLASMHLTVDMQLSTRCLHSRLRDVHILTGKRTLILPD